MNAFIGAALSRIRTVVLLFALAMVAGIISLNNIPRESSPDITIPIVYISISHEGISAEDADRMLYLPMYKELKSLEGLKTVISNAISGHLTIQLEFQTNIDMDDALIDVRKAVDIAKAELPAATEEPKVLEINLSLLPVMVLGLSGNVDERELFSIANNLKEKLEGLNGVLESRILGEREEVVEIIIEPAKLDSYNIDHDDLFQLTSDNNQLVAAGHLDTGIGRFAVKVPGLIENIDDILAMPVKVAGSKVVHFSDIAFIQRAYKAARSRVRINGKPALALEISKRLGSNLIETLDQVKIMVAKEKLSWPDAIDVAFIQDQSKEIELTLDELFDSVFFSTILVMIIIIGALGVRSSLLVGIAIPGSFLIAIMMLNFMGYTLNMVVLFALILSIGMLIDGAIVIIEYADRRMAEGIAKKPAFIEAAKRMAWPITSSTATTLVVFLPLLYWPGTVGEFMKYIPITIITTLSASLFIALIVIPALGAWFGKSGAFNEHTLKAVRATEVGDLNALTGFTGRYVRLLSQLVKRPVKTLLGGSIIMLAVIFLYGLLGNGVEFFPTVNSDMALVDVRARGNLSLEERDELVHEVEQRLYAMSEIKTLYTTTYISPPGDTAVDLVGQIQIELVDWQQRRNSKSILEDIRDRTNDIAGIKIETKEDEDGPASSGSIKLEVTGANNEVLLAVIGQIRRHLELDPELRDIKDSRPLEGVEWELSVDREVASSLGASISSVGSLVKLVTSGLKLGSYRPENADGELDIIMRFPNSSRNLDQLDRLQFSSQGQLIPISSFTNKIARKQSGNLVRIGNNLRYIIDANLQEGVNDTYKREQIQEALEEIELPPGINFHFIGDAEEMTETINFLGNAFLFAIFLMVVILVTQFNSLYRTAVVLSAIILSFVGVLMGLLIFGQPFGIVMSGVGMIALAGVVVNNNIVLIDTYFHLRNKGFDAIDAAIRTGAQRLRPVLLTSITTAFGLLPLVFQVNIDLINRDILIGAPSSQWWTQLSTAIVGGLAFATFFTLLLTPCLLVLEESFKRFSNSIINLFKAGGSLTR